MKDKLFLLTILLLSLAIGLMMPIVEGATCSSSSYVSGGTGGSGTGSGTTGAPVKWGNSSEKAKACKVISDSENATRLTDVTGLLISKLGGKVDNTYDSSNKLMERSEKLQKNSKSLNNLANDKDVDTGDACKQYPEAC